MIPIANGFSIMLSFINCYLRRCFLNFRNKTGNFDMLPSSKLVLYWAESLFQLIYNLRHSLMNLVSVFQKWSKLRKNSSQKRYIYVIRYRLRVKVQGPCIIVRFVVIFKVKFSQLLAFSVLGLTLLAVISVLYF